MKFWWRAKRDLLYISCVLWHVSICLLMDLGWDGQGHEEAHDIVILSYQESPCDNNKQYYIILFYYPLLIISSFYFYYFRSFL